MASVTRAFLRVRGPFVELLFISCPFLGAPAAG
jgi:hypothetical protein